MGENERLLDMDIVLRHKAVITERWAQTVSSTHPEMEAVFDLTEHGGQFFDLLMDVSVPVELHPAFAEFPGWCKLLVDAGIPMAASLDCHQAWWSAVMESIATEEDAAAAARLAVMQTITPRLHTIVRYLCELYWIQMKLALDDKDARIDELNEERVNVIGKMAASMAHEVRNPLTAIGGFIKLIRFHLPPDALAKVNKYISFLEDEFHNIHMQITGFLSFSKKPVMEESPVSISIQQLVDSVLALIQPRLANENVHLTTSLPKYIRLHVQKIAIQLVLSNLLHNSIDALSQTSSRKEITIRSFEDNGHYYVRIANNGPEIPDDLKAGLFSPFVTGKVDGTGLGLAICKQIMSKNGGSITFTSTQRETAFILSFAKKTF